VRLSDLPLPDGAEDRTLQVVREAFAARIPNPRRRTIRRSLPVVVVAVVAALAISTVAVRASGGTVLDTVRDALGVRNAATVLTRLPATGRLLVNSSTGPWIVNPDGAKRHLGTGYTQASWSPHGLFEVVVTQGHELAAIDPKGNLRWSLARPAISGARWSGDGYRIAYRAGSSLRVVAGDGTGDHLVARGTAAAAPAWDGATHRLAYADRSGRIHLVDADTGRTIWISKAGGRPTQLAWAQSRREIISVGSRGVRVLRARNGSLFKEIPLAPGPHQLAISPIGPAVVTSRTAGGQTALLIIHPEHPALAPRPIFRGAGRFNSLSWSPNGQWLLASWASANQWVFIKLAAQTGALERVQAVSAIKSEFNSATPTSLGGWCCAAGGPPN
jgi:hypothetical protein